MKTLMALALTLSLTSAFANNPEDRATTGSPAEVGSTTGTYGAEAPPVNDTSASDTVSTSRASTLRSRREERMNRRRDQRNTTAPASCVDRDGRTYGSSDAGYSACRSSMRK